MRLSLYKWTLFLLLFFQWCQCAKVLFTVFHDRGSHFASMFPLMEKLARHGHAVSVLDTIHRSDRSPLIRHIRAPLPHAEVEDEAERHAFAEFFWNQTDSSVTLPEFYRQSDEQLATLMLNHSEKMVDLINEDWDLLVIDDLMWPFGYFMATLKRRFWDSARNGPRPHLIVYGTAAQTLISAESVRAISRNWVSRVPFCPFVPTDSRDVFRPSLFSHRLFAFYENFAEIVLMNWITESYTMPNIAKFGVPNFTWAELFRQTEYEFSDFIDRMGWPLAHGPEMVNLGSHCRSAVVPLLGFCAGVPMIVMPLFAEQAHQAHLLLAMGMAAVINKYSLTEQSVLHTIQTVISDPKSLSRARKLRDIFTDRIIPPLDEALFRVERLVDSRKSAQSEKRQRNFLRRKGTEIGWTEFAHGELAILIMTIITVLASIIL